MLQKGSLGPVFQTYWADVDRCRRAKAYWSLLHVLVCLPDICAALQSENGETTGKRYTAWCDQYLGDPMLTGAERYRMRCKVLHQGRASTDQAGRYAAFAFGQPAQTGQVDHMRVDAGTLHLDVGELTDEMRRAVEKWIITLEAQPTSAEAVNVATNLPSLVRVTDVPIVQPPAPMAGDIAIQTIIINKTN